MKAAGIKKKAFNNNKSIWIHTQKCALESCRELCTVCKWVSVSALATVLCQPFPSNKMSDSIRILSKRQSTLPGHNKQECAYQEYGVLKQVPKDVGFQKHIFHLRNSKLKKTKQNQKLTWEQPIKCSTWTSPCVKIHFESCTVALQYKDMFVQYKGLQVTNATKPTVQYEAGSLILWCYFFCFWCFRHS